MKAYVIELVDEKRAFLLFEDGDERGVYSGHSDGIRALTDRLICPVVWLKSDVVSGLRLWAELDGNEEKPIAHSVTARLHDKAEGKEEEVIAMYGPGAPRPDPKPTPRPPTPA